MLLLSSGTYIIHEIGKGTLNSASPSWLVMDVLFARKLVPPPQLLLLLPSVFLKKYPCECCSSWCTPKGFDSFWRTGCYCNVKLLVCGCTQPAPPTLKTVPTESKRLAGLPCSTHLQEYEMQCWGAGRRNKDFFPC